MYGYPGSVAQRKQERGRWRYLDLLVVSRSFQFPSALKQSVVEFGCALDCRTVYGARNTVKFRVRRIEQNYAPIGKQTGKQARKCAAKILSRTVGLSQELRDFGIAQQSGGGFNYRLNFGTKSHRPHRRVGQSSTSWRKVSAAKHPTLKMKRG